MTTARPGRLATRLGKRPGPKPRLSREAIIDAAIRAGIEHVTMQSVATALGSSAPGLYRYFDSRDELVVAALQHLLTSLPLPAAADGWRAFLQAEVDYRWELLTRYAGLLHDNAASLESIATDRMLRLVHGLVGFGFTVPAAVLAVDAVLDLVHDGAAQAARLFDPDDPARLSPEMRRKLEQCPADVRAAIEEIVADPKAHVDRKLTLTLDGLAARRADG